MSIVFYWKCVGQGKYIPLGVSRGASIAPKGLQLSVLDPEIVPAQTMHLDRGNSFNANLHLT